MVVDIFHHLEDLPEMVVEVQVEMVLDQGEQMELTAPMALVAVAAVVDQDQPVELVAMVVMES